MSQQERCKHRNIKDLQLAFSEFYLSLILLQNYQVNNSMLIICIFPKTKYSGISLWIYIVCFDTHLDKFSPGNKYIAFVYLEPEFHRFQEDFEEA